MMRTAALPLPAWLRNVRVDVTDDRAADGITPAALVAYLTAKGWEKTHDRYVVQWWRHADMPERATALVPQEETAIDYQRCVLNLARTIARQEQRGILAVLHDLHTVQAPGEMLVRRGRPPVRRGRTR